MKNNKHINYSFILIVFIALIVSYCLNVNCAASSYDNEIIKLLNNSDLLFSLKLEEINYNNTFSAQFYLYSLGYIMHYFYDSLITLRFLSFISFVFLLISCYFFYKLLSESKITPLIGVFILTTSLWGLIILRSGIIENISISLFVLTLYFVLKGCKTQSNIYFLISGIIFAAMVYSNAYTLFLIIIPIITILLFQNKFDSKIKLYEGLSYFLCLLLILVSPVMFQFISDPVLYLTNIIFINPENLLNTIYNYSRFHLLINFKEFSSFIFDPITSFLFLLGLATTIKNYKRKENLLLILLLISVSVLSILLTPLNNSGLGNYILILPIIAYFVGFSIAEILIPALNSLNYFEKLEKTQIKAVNTVIICAFCLIILLINYYSYFQLFPTSG